MPKRSADAQWEGNLPKGHGTIRFDAWQGAYSFASRFEDGQGTNPEELIAAAHAGCFSMAFSAMLSDAGHTPNKVHTTATVYIEKVEGGFGITRIHLNCEGDVPGIDDANFQDIANQAKAGCPVSRALAAVPEITLEATLIQQ